MNDAISLADLMVEFSNMGMALRKDVYHFITGGSIDELPVYSLGYTEDILKKMSMFAVDNTVDMLLDEIREKKHVVNSPYSQDDHLSW